MFKKLKEKITEEVKSSPQRFQQFTQSVSDKLQNSTASDDNFFSIADDDANVSTASVEPGFSSVSLVSPQENNLRRNSSSSMASDVSFLPRYESSSNMYHLQSDLDVSTSEMEDNASTSSQLGFLSKEQIYSAFQKAQTRYHKYRGRYTDLAKHYKNLEHEIIKMKSVLEETQDKAIRRVTELKEQCGLEQKAKAHLEAALRDEIDEKQFKIESLETKVGLLQNGAKGGEENLELLDKYLTDARQEIETLNERIQEMKANSIIQQTKDQENKVKIASLEKEIALFSEREKENNLMLAQNKRELHNELLSKDSEISSLKQETEALKQSLGSSAGGSIKLENLQAQNTNLIEKLEKLTLKCNGYESDLLKMEQLKIELHNAVQNSLDLSGRLVVAEEQCVMVREEAKKSLLALETKVRSQVQKEFEHREEELKKEFQRKFEDVSSNAHDLQQIQLNLVAKDKEIKRLEEVNDRITVELNQQKSKYAELENNHLELIDDAVGLRNKIVTLDKEVLVMQGTCQASEARTARLEERLVHLDEERLDVLQMFPPSNDLQSLKLKFKELEQENTGLLDQIHRDSELRENVKQAQQREGVLEERAKDLQKLVHELENTKTSFEEEKLQLLEQLHYNKSMVANLTEENARNLNNVEVLNSENFTKSSLLLEKDNIVNELETSKSELLARVQGIEEELECYRQSKPQLQEELQKLRLTLDEKQLLQERVKSLEQNNQEGSKQFEEKQIQVSSLEERIDCLNRELEVVTVLQKKNEELEGEKVQLVDEISLLKKLLEEASNHVTIKEHELSRIKEDHGQEIQNSAQLEEQLRLKVVNYEKDLKMKNEEIDSLSRKLNDYSEGLHQVVSSLPGQHMNHFKGNKEQLDYLREFQSRISSEKSRLEQEKEQLVEEAVQFRRQVLELSSTNVSIQQIEVELLQLREENYNLSGTVEKLKENILELESRNTQIVSDCNFVSDENQTLLTEVEGLKVKDKDLKRQFEGSLVEITRLKSETLELGSKLDKMAQLEGQVNELEREKQLLADEIQELKIAPLNNHIQENVSSKEIEHLRDKLTQYKSLDLTNRTSIEFYEGELQKLKVQNEKLNRKLDETLVTLNHCADLSSSTEIEYLRNVLYNYMLGKESLVLARVIAAVCKFDPHQTEVILAKEHQKQTLLGQLGIL